MPLACKDEMGIDINHNNHHKAEENRHYLRHVMRKPALHGNHAAIATDQCLCLCYIDITS